MPTNDDDDDLLDPKQSAKELGDVSPNTLAVWRSTGRYGIPFIKVGAKVKYRRGVLRAWLKSRTRASGATK